MYREFLRHLLIEVKEGEVYDTPLWLKPILNTIPEFGLDGRRKEFLASYIDALTVSTSSGTGEPSLDIKVIV